MEPLLSSRPQIHLFNTPAFTNVIPKFLQFFSSCSSEYNPYSPFAFWLYVFLSFLGVSMAIFSYYLVGHANKRNRTAHGRAVARAEGGDNVLGKGWYVKHSIGLVLNFWFINYVLHGILNCWGWHAFGRTLLMGIPISIIMLFIPN